MAHNLITDLTLGNRSCKLKCRLARIWDCTNPSQHHRLISVDFLLVDEKGSSIQGTIRHQDGHWLKEVVREGNIYLWSGFVVIKANPLYRACSNAYYISVSRTTTKFQQISNEGLENFPYNSFNFVDYQTLSARVDNNSYLSDVIGELTSMSSIDETIVHNNPVRKRNLQLLDAAGINVKATLWSNVADQLNDMQVQDLSKKGCIIIVIAAVGVTKFSGNVALTSKSGTRIYLNLPIPEAKIFQLRLKEPTSVTFVPPSESAKDRMLKNRNTIAELSQFTAKDNMNTKFTCKATITDIDSTKEWWFSSCPDCKSQIKDDDAWCRRCQKVIEETPVPWYKINIVIADDTGDLTLTIFGKHVERLAKHSASDLAKSKNASSYVLPQPIIKLIGISRIFELQIWEKQTYSNNTPVSFKVTGVFEEEENSEKELLSTPLSNNNSECSAQSEIEDTSSANQKQLTPPPKRLTIKIDKEDPKYNTLPQPSVVTKRKHPSSTTANG